MPHLNDVPAYQDDDGTKYVHAEDLITWAFLLLAPKLEGKDARITAKDMQNLAQIRPQLLDAVARVEEQPERWLKLVPDSFLKLAKRGAVRSGSGTGREPGGGVAKGRVA